MKRVLCILLVIIILFCFKIDHFSLSKLSDSLAEKEIAVTFINKSLLLINIKDNEFLIKFTPNGMIKQYIDVVRREASYESKNVIKELLYFLTNDIP